MMPGDPSRFFIKPGMAPEAYHLIAVRYGFEKEIPAPGNKYEKAGLDTNLKGAYGLEINATDEAGNSAFYYGVYNKPGRAPIYLNVDENTSVYNITVLSQPALNSDVDLRLELICESDCSKSDFLVNITHDGGVIQSLPLGYIQNTTIDVGGDLKDVYEYMGTTQTLTTVGNYFVSFNTSDTSGNLIFNIVGFSINRSPAELAPFTIENLAILEEDQQQTKITVSASITATTGFKEASLTILSPKLEGKVETMFRGTVFVEVPHWEQFIIYMRNMLSFDFGNSFVSGRPVWDELSQKIPPTLLLFGSALILSAILGILFGVVMAWRRGSKREIAGIVISLFFYSMPIFWFGLILLAFFSFQLGWFPLRGMLTPGADYQGLEYVADLLWHLTLPLITLTIAHLAGWLLLMRNSMLEVMGEDYITTAKAKGLTERKVMYRHAARNAMLPIVTAIALSLGGVVSGGVLTETIFSWPGMGQYLITSTYAYDFPAVQGAFFLLAILTIIANLFADLLYAYLDPRVRLGR